MAPSILLFVVADQGAARNEHVAVDDGALDPGMPADPHPRHQNALVDLAETVDADVGTQHAARHGAARHDAPGRDHGIQCLTAPLPDFGEHEFRRRRLRLVRAQRPFRIVQIEFRVHVTQIHVRFEVRVERPDVAPVLRRLLVLVVEAIGIDRHFVDQRGNDVLAEIMVRRLHRVGLERPHEHVGVEHIHAHRGKRQLRRSRNAVRVLRLLLEAGDPLVLVDGDNPEAAHLVDRDLDRRQRDRGPALLVNPEHARVIHFVDVVARQHDELARILARDRVQILVHRIGGALIPLLADAFLRWQDLDELAQLLRYDAPAHADVAIERERLVLGSDEDAPQAGIDAVAEDEIDDAVGSAEIHSRFGPVHGQGVKALAGAAGQNDDETVVEKSLHWVGPHLH